MRSGLISVAREIEENELSAYTVKVSLFLGSISSKLAQSVFKLKVKGSAKKIK